MFREKIQLLRHYNFEQYEHIQFANNANDIDSKVMDCITFIARFLRDKSGLAIELPKFPPYHVDWFNGNIPILLQSTLAFLLQNQAFNVSQIIFSMALLEQNDIVFFRYPRAKQIHHCGVYIPPNHYLHCFPGHGVCVNYMNDKIFAFGARIKWESKPLLQ